jgi:large subunit ribosomal protein L4
MTSAAKVPLLDKSGKAVGTVEVPAALAREPKAAVLHFAVMRVLANRRAGTADTKTRAEVRGGGRKPWRQKGTGRARHGSIRSPIWRKGGVVFGPHPRSYEIAMNRRARRAALAMAVAAKAADGGVSIIDAGGLNPAKTKDMISVLWSGDAKAGSDRVLFVLHPKKDEHAGAIARAGRNLAKATFIPFPQTDPHNVLAHDRVIFTKNAYEALAEVCHG